MWMVRTQMEKTKIGLKSTRLVARLGCSTVYVSLGPDKLDKHPGAAPGYIKLNGAGAAPGSKQNHARYLL